MNPHLHLWLLPLLPLVGGVINGLFGRHFSRRTVAAVAIGFCGAAFVLALWVLAQFFSLALPYHEAFAPWMRAGSFQAAYGFYLDQLSLAMLLVVTGVGFVIHVYSIGYMWEEGGFYRFFSYMNLFMFFMLMLVLADNYLMMFIGWEGVGLASYLLIGFFFLRDSAASAGKKAFIVNRIGDFAFLIALFLMIRHFGSLNFDRVFQAVAPMGSEAAGAGLLTAIGVLLMIGACGKSAQIPLYVWLPDAMEGPTPVSALIHAATMVTAGVYMVARSHVIYDRAPDALTLVAIIGVITAFFAATIGIAQTDIKKVLAYSTISQLGYMFLACGVGAYWAGIFHLMTHAFFKGLLFLAAGSVIHAIGGEQDMRRMGGLRTKIPWTFWTMTAATFAIAGVPPLAGYFSKDEILWQASRVSMVYWGIGAFTAFLTAFYMFRLWFLTFFGEYRGAAAEAHAHAEHAAHGAHLGREEHQSGIHESPKVMLVPLVILAVLSVVGGWVNISKHFEHFLEPVFRSGVTAFSAQQAAATEASRTVAAQPGTELLFTLISVLAAALGIFLAWLLYHRRPQLPQQIADVLGGFYHAVVNKYYVDELYALIFVKPLVVGSQKILWRGIDQNVIDVSLDTSADTARDISDTVRRMQSGNVRSYAGWIALGAAGVIIYMVWMGLR